jgi:putative iron-regulated protein
MKIIPVPAAIGIALLVAAPAAAETPAAREILATYADIAHAAYEDSLITAEQLKGAIAALVADPTDEHLAKARDAWRAARVPYQQTEGYRFGNAIVDDWEGRVNAWPLDEGLIDYVDAGYGDSSDENPLYVANVIANKEITLGGETIDAAVITKELLSEKLHEAGGVAANVATGYHAIEFLLWGQDLNGAGPGSGARPASDLSASGCTGGNCDRRVAYLTTAADLLTDDLQEMVEAWGPDGAARAELLKDEQAGLAAILTGLGSLSYGELAGERMKLGLLLHDPEEEHDCFSDNTHNSHYYNQVGMIAIYTGRYTRVDGSTVSGPSLAALAAAKAPKANTRLLADMDATLAAMTVMKEAVDSGRMAYDQMLAEDNPEGNKILDTIVTALVQQTRSIEGVVAALDLAIEIEGSDSLDDPSAIAQ